MSDTRVSSIKHGVRYFYSIADAIDDIPLQQHSRYETEKKTARKTWSYGTVSKRACDISFSVVLIVCCLPLMALVAAAVAGSGQPILYRSRRVGLGGVVFDCLKFRTMVPDADAALAALLQSDASARDEWLRTCKLDRDPRVTRVGRVLRATSLDELPQLFNVLFGQMSLVGPRPVPMQELRDRYGQHAVHYLSVRPGLTGPWQVSGRSDVSYEARVSLDVAYAQNPSLLTDLRILLRTVVVVLARKGAR